MLGVGGVAPPSSPPTVVLKRASGTTGKPTVFSFLLQNQTHKPKKTLFPVHNYTHSLQRRNGYCLHAQKKQQGSSLGSIELEKEANFVEDEGFELDDEFDFEDEDFDDEEEEEGDDDKVEEGDLLLPFGQMDDWLKNKPKGFGEGKVYDTSIEDKLMGEIEQSRKAQRANLNKLKNKSKEANSKKELKESTASEVVSSEIRVRINNLPKKMNVHRDLRSAFKGVRGIANIAPEVFGNKKTRDPICKGYGFVDFTSLEDATRFVEMFSGQTVAFGKIQKRIKCDILKSHIVVDKGSVPQGHTSTSEPRIAASEDEVDDDQNLAFQETDPPLLFWEEKDFDEDFDCENDADDFELVRASEQGNNDVLGSVLEAGLDSSSLKPKRKAKGEKKNSVTDRKPDKIPEPSILGSATRLKIRERADLSEVFARHGVNFQEALTLIETSVASVDIGDQDSDIEEKDPSVEIFEADDFYEDDEEPYDDDDAENSELVKASEQEGDNRTESSKKPAPPSVPSVHNEKTKADVKKTEVRGEQAKEVPVISVEELGELLRIRDPAVLNEFVSRLGELQKREDEEPDIESLLQFLAENAPEDLHDEYVPDTEILGALKDGNSNGIKSKKAMASSNSSSSAKRKEKKGKAAKKASSAKDKASKAPKQKVLGSAQKLKSRGKTKLSVVFTKYAGNETLASKEK